MRLGAYDLITSTQTSTYILFCYQNTGKDI